MAGVVDTIRDKRIALGLVVGWCALVLWSVARWHGRISKVHARGLNAALKSFLRKTRSQDTLMVPRGHLESRMDGSSALRTVVYRSQRRNLYKYLFEACFLKALSSVAFTGLLCMSLVWLLVDALYEKRISLGAMLEHIAASLRIFEATVPLLSVMLALYVQIRLARVRAVVTAVQALQDSLEEIGLVVGTSASRSYEKPEVQEALWSLFRMLNLFHVQVYRQILDRHSQLSSEELCRAGFLTPAELNQLEASADPNSTVIVWICQLLTLMVETQVLDIQIAGHLLKGVYRIRGMASQLLEEVSRTPTVSMLQLMRFMTDIVCILTPPALIFDYVSGRTIYDVVVPLARMKIPDTASASAESLLDQSRNSAYGIPTICSLVIAFFLQGSLAVIHETQHLFEMDIDSLDPTRILGETEKRILAFMNVTPPFKMQPVTLRSVAQDAKSVVSGMLSQSGSESMGEVGGAPSEISVGGSSYSRASSSVAGPEIYGKAQVLLGAKMLQHISADADKRTVELQRHALGAVASAAAAAAKDSATEVREKSKMGGEFELLEMLRNASRENARLREQLITALSTGGPPAQVVDAMSAGGSSAGSVRSGSDRSDYRRERRR